MSKSISKIHRELLDSHRQELLNDLSGLDGFVLGGGTGLALQIAHRKSFDLDFFTQKEIPNKLLEQVKKIIDLGTVSVDNVDELTLFDKEQVKITFLRYPFPRVHPLVKLENGYVFSVEEIAVHKAYTIGRRGEYRDYFDLYSILRGEYMELDEVVKTAQTVYQNAFNPKLFIEQLVYFEDLKDLEIEPIDSDQQLPKPPEVLRYFEQLVKEYI